MDDRTKILMTYYIKSSFYYIHVHVQEYVIQRMFLFYLLVVAVVVKFKGCQSKNILANETSNGQSTRK